MRVIDLTGTIEPDMWSYGPPIPEVTVTQVARIGVQGWDAHAFQLATIVGTYLETAAHLIPGAPTIDQIAPERFIVDAAVLRVPPKQAREHITVADLEAADVELRPGMALLVATGWDRRWNEPDYVVGSPHFTPDAMDWIVERRPSILGLDVPCSEDPVEPEDLNSALFRTGALLLAPLVNLGAIARPYIRLLALPLKIKGVCGTPCRALALEE